MNIEASSAALEELTTNFKYNDAVIRNLVIRMNAPVTEESSIMKAEAEQRERKARYDAAQVEKAKEKEKIADSDKSTSVENEAE